MKAVNINRNENNQCLRSNYNDACVAENKIPVKIIFGGTVLIKKTRPYIFVRRVYYALKDWDTTIDNIRIAGEIRPYKNKHKNEPCVIVGNGPSLTAEDLTRLYDLNVSTFACNRIHLIFPQTNWRPTYYFISDPKIIMQYEGEIEGVDPEHRFFPKRYRDIIAEGVFYNTLEFDWENEGKFSLDASKGIYPAASVTTEMIQFAYYMGFNEIYLIGVDFNYNIKQKDDDGTYKYQGENNYFVSGYLKPGEVADIPNIKANLLGFNAAKDAIEGQGRIIKNATRGGKLEVFERADLDRLFLQWEFNRRNVNK